MRESGNTILLRQATAADLEVILHHRRSMFTDMGVGGEGGHEAMIGWCREQGFGSVSLHAGDAGRPLYESLGFVPTNEMRLVL